MAGSDMRTAVAVDADGRAVISVAGEVDLANVDELRACLLEAWSASPTAGLVVDLSQVTFFGAAAVGVLLDVREITGGDDRHHLHVIALSDIVRRVLEITEATTLLM